MSRTTYLCINGTFTNALEPVLHSNNRAFRYGDALTEDIHAYATEPQFLSYHLAKLKRGMEILAMETPGSFTVENFRELIVRLLNKNRIFGGAHIRMSVFRDSNGNLLPEHKHISFLLESSAMVADHYTLNEKGLVVDICPDYVKNTGPFSSLASANKLLYVMASLYASARNLDEVVLLNEAGRITESAGSNIFLVSGTSIFTPGEKQGCIAGVLRQIILELAADTGYTINDQSSLTHAVLEDAEEVFLVNSIDGIRWVGAFRQRRYYKKNAQILLRKLNELAFGKE
jgi:branched-chain amino acid aminotransferase